MVMWKDDVKKIFWWHEMNCRRDELIHALQQAEDEEESGLYLLHLHQIHLQESDCFSETDAEIIKHLLDRLIADTAYHKELLGTIISEIEKR